MKSRLRILCLVLLASCCLPQTSPAQRVESAEVRDVHDVNGYTIRIVRMERDSYGYEIRRGPEVLVHQRRNPFTGSERGLERKVDALNTATWLVQNALPKERVGPAARRLPVRSAFSRPLPSTVARVLGVTLDR